MNVAVETQYDIALRAALNASSRIEIMRWWLHRNWWECRDQGGPIETLTGERVRLLCNKLATTDGLALVGEPEFSQYPSCSLSDVHALWLQCPCEPSCSDEQAFMLLRIVFSRVPVSAHSIALSALHLLPTEIPPHWKAVYELSAKLTGSTR